MARPSAPTQTRTRICSTALKGGSAKFEPITRFDIYTDDIPNEALERVSLPLLLFPATLAVNGADIEANTRLIVQIWTFSVVACPQAGGTRDCWRYRNHAYSNQDPLGLVGSEAIAKAHAGCFGQV